MKTKTYIKETGLARNRKVLTTIFAAFTLAATTLAASAAHAAADVAHFSENGASVIVAFSDQTTGAPGLMTVGKGGANSKETFLWFEETKCDDVTGCSGIAGYGRIPNQDFLVNAEKAELDTDVMGNPNFYAYQWSGDFIDGTYKETQILSGRLTFSFQKTGSVSNTFHGTETSKFFDTTFKRVGRWTSWDAAASGTLFGSVVSSGGATISMTHTTSLYITRD